MVDAFINSMAHYKAVKIIEVSDPSGERDTPLTERTNLANKHGVDVYIAFHHNAYRGLWFNGGGSEVHVRPYRRSIINWLLSLLHWFPKQWGLQIGA
jgi:N-acetylmuramoyl-L-alanine amidase